MHCILFEFVNQFKFEENFLQSINNARKNDQSGVPVKVFHTIIWVQIARTFIRRF